MRRWSRRWWRERGAAAGRSWRRATCTGAGGCTMRPARHCTRSPAAGSSRSRSPACATAAATTTTRSGGGSPTAATSPGAPAASLSPCFLACFALHSISPFPPLSRYGPHVSVYVCVYVHTPCARRCG
uniref:Uncharacterized protein n=1 Tax=Arundo donax TaxID=35708 RepID=A0A0A9FBZ6_ARUDO